MSTWVCTYRSSHSGSIVLHGFSTFPCKDSWRYSSFCGLTAKLRNEWDKVDSKEPTKYFEYPIAFRQRCLFAVTIFSHFTACKVSVYLFLFPNLSNSKEVLQNLPHRKVRTVKIYLDLIQTTKFQSWIHIIYNILYSMSNYRTNDWGWFIRLYSFCNFWSYGEGFHTNASGVPV